MNLKKLYKFLIKNYFITVFFACIVFVGLVSFYKLFISKPYYIYTKVKLGQGQWWTASYNKPSIWLATSIKKGDFEKDLTGKTIVEVLGVKYYPWLYYDQFDVYLTLKLKVSANKKTKKYTFKRSSIGVGSPIELELSSTQVSGTIIELSEGEFDEEYVDKTIILTKKYAFPWEYEAIKAGDKYFDGEDYVFEILDKKATSTSILSSDSPGHISSSPEERKYINVKAKIKVKEKGEQLIFGEEQIIQPGKMITISTPNFSFDEFFVGEVK